MRDQKHKHENGQDENTLKHLAPQKATLKHPMEDPRRDDRDDTQSN